MDISEITVAVLCGGKATRLQPLTESLPKALIPVGGKPIVEDLLLHLREQGFTKFVLCEGHLAEKLQAHLGDGTKFGVTITHVVEPEPLGTGGALRYAEKHLSDPFIAIQGDLVVRADLRAMLAFHERKRATATLLGHRSSHPQDSDLLDADEEWRLRRIFRPVQGETFKNIGNAGIAIVAKELLAQAPAGKLGLEKGIIAPAVQKGTVYAYYTEEYVKDMGTLERLDEVNRIMARLGEPRPAVFLDRDGVIIEEKHLLTRKEQVELIPGSADAIRRLNEAGYAVIMVSNQPVVARNLCTEDDVHDVNDCVQALLVAEGAYLDRSYFCPHHPERGHPEADDPRYRRACECRKPKPGMLLQAAKELHLDLERSFMVGDTTSDIVAGNDAGCTTILVETGHAGKDGKHAATPDLICRSLEEAADAILKKDGASQHARRRP